MEFVFYSVALPTLRYMFISLEILIVFDIFITHNLIIFKSIRQ